MKYKFILFSPWLLKSPVSGKTATVQAGLDEEVRTFCGPAVEEESKPYSL